jgi:hypothetical protein
MNILLMAMSTFTKKPYFKTKILNGGKVLMIKKQSKKKEEKKCNQSIKRS